ncbi:MAG: DNA cytosine methyltransferase [Deltaproteobacteria bacterium]|jgi:DNA (cytosine-5)-methyltransferase 1|nr:DNA cytosine methyltransferase [Deltaproteobacteria bacterium]
MNVVDFFAGCGGASRGFQAAGLKIVAAIESNLDAAATFALNFPQAKIYPRDIRLLQPQDIKPSLAKLTGPLLFVAGAPCQPFSKLNRLKRDDDARIGLLAEFTRFVEFYRPDYIFIENAPGLKKYQAENSPLNTFIETLIGLGYPSPKEAVVTALEYGVPQVRPRLIVIASKHGELDFPGPTHGQRRPEVPYATVRDWIGDLPPLKAGEKDPLDPDHQAAGLSPLNLERLRYTPEGGDRCHWPTRLKLPGHKRLLKETGHEGYGDVYGRLAFNKPASSLTTRCVSYSNGRFGHPTQDRAISLREAASIQTFPRDFRFMGSLNSRARQVGNAVPPLLAERFGRLFRAVEKGRLKGR